MNKIGKIAGNLWKAMRRHSPEILTGIGIAGMATTAVMAVKATPKALYLLEERKKEEHKDTLTAAETVKTVWKCYIPAAIVEGASAACLIGASSVNLRRNAALATAYSLSESALKEYQEKVVETFGEKKEQTVRDAIAKDRITDNPVSQNKVIFTQKGDTLCYDSWSGRYFKSDMDTLKRAVNELNRQMRDEIFISLNDLYYELGLDNVKSGDILGWDMEKGYIDMDFSSQLTEDGVPCLVIDYKIAPQYCP